MLAYHQPIYATRLGPNVRFWPPQRTAQNGPYLRAYHKRRSFRSGSRPKDCWINMPCPLARSCGSYLCYTNNIHHAKCCRGSGRGMISMLSIPSMNRLLTNYHSQLAVPLISTVKSTRRLSPSSQTTSMKRTPTWSRLRRIPITMRVPSPTPLHPTMTFLRSATGSLPSVPCLSDVFVVPLSTLPTSILV